MNGIATPYSTPGAMARAAKTRRILPTLPGVATAWLERHKAYTPAGLAAAFVPFSPLAFFGAFVSWKAARGTDCPQIWGAGTSRRTAKTAFKFPTAGVDAYNRRNPIALRSVAAAESATESPRRQLTLCAAVAGRGGVGPYKMLANPGHTTCRAREHPREPR